MRVYSRLVQLVALVCFSLSGCVRAPKLIIGEVLVPADSEELCGSLNTVMERSTTFRTLLDATVTPPSGDPVSFRYAIVGKDPEMLRVDVLPTEGAYTLALITVRGSEALFLDPQAKRVTHDCSAVEVLEKFLGLRGMTPAAVKAIVLGRVPHLECGRVTVSRPTPDRVLLVDRVEQIAWEIDVATGDLQRAHFLSRSGESVTAVASREIRGADSFIVVSVHDPIKATAEMRVARLTKNQDVADATFFVAVPAGYEQEGC
jgi:hypothetical protein